MVRRAHVIALATLSLLPAAEATELVSVTSSGEQGNAYSVMPSVSDDGRRVVFTSFAGNLAAGDSNDNFDIFLRDRLKGTTTRISTASDGRQLQGASVYGRISGDGSRAVFVSSAPGRGLRDFNGSNDIFVRTIENDDVQLISVALSGAAGDGESSLPALTRDGSRVVFTSTATDLVADDRNAFTDIFLRDLRSTSTIVLSRAENGAEADGDSTHPAISADGDQVVFATDAQNIAAGDRPGYRDIVMVELASGRRANVSADAGPGDCDSPSVSVDGRIAFVCDRIFFEGTRPFRRKAMFVYENGALRLLPVAGDEGNAAQGVLSADGSTLVFLSTSADSGALSQVVLYDLKESRAYLLSDPECRGSGGNRHSYQPAVSGDGRWVAFRSNATDLVADDRNLTDDIFMVDRTSLASPCPYRLAARPVLQWAP